MYPWQYYHIYGLRFSYYTSSVVTDKRNVAGSLNLIPSIVFVLFILKYDLVLMYVPLRSAVALTSSICLYYILGNYELARSQGGRQPAAANILLYVCIIIIRGTFLW